MKKLKINQPVYKTKLPSGTEVSYTPFTIGNEKSLQVAMETKNQTTIVETLKNVIKECTAVSNPPINVDTLPIFDIEMLFLLLRTRSVGETITLNLICPDDGVTEVEYELDIEKIKPKTNKNHKKEITIANYKFGMKYPGFDTFVDNAILNENDLDSVIKLIASCIDTIIDLETEEVVVASDYGLDELVDFLETLPQKEFARIKEFFETMPTISHTAKIKNPNTGVVSDVVIQGLSSFLK